MRHWTEGPAAWISALSGVILVVLGLLAWKANSDDDRDAGPSEPSARCAQEATGPAPAPSVNQAATLTSPHSVSVEASSDATPGHYTLTLYWSTTDDRATSNIAMVAGRYGTPAPAGDDFPITGNSKVPATGHCGTWLRRLGRMGPATFTGLWPNEVYCFKLWSTDDDGARTPPEPSPMSMPTCTETGPG